jgi:K+-sensing histidine kinase KdpD
MFYKIWSIFSSKECSGKVSESLMARFSHEFRTHLTGIVGYSEFLESSENEPMTNFTAKIIRESSLSLSKVGAAYFELNKLLNKKFSPKYSNFIFSELVRDVVRQHQMQALQHEISLGYTCSDDVMEKVFNADESRLRQVIDLLIDETVRLLDKWSILHVVLSVDAKYEVWLLSLEFSDIAAKSSQMTLYKLFWNEFNYKFKLQEGPGVVLAMVKQMLLSMNCDFRLELDRDLSGARLVIAFPSP